ncbi:MAG: cytochrome c3 family protein [Thermodesulfobacteriota bacterium]
MIGLLLLLVLLLPTTVWGSADGLPCVLCHPSRDREVFEILSRTPGVLVGSEGSQAFVCLSCHNGSVVDSRDRLLRGGQHPAGVRVSRALPAEYPLYGAGQMTCGTCHSPHGEGPGAARWLRVAPDGVAPCAGCHPARRGSHLGRSLSPERTGRIRGAGGRPGSAEDVTCLTCHTPHAASGDRLLVAPYGAERDDLCRTCHPGVSVKGVAAGGRSRPCSQCHAPHGDAPRLLTGGEKGPCIPCHADRRGPGDHRVVHPACAECHSVHSPVKMGGRSAGLLRTPAEGGLLCEPCHADLGARHRPGSPLETVNAGLLRARGLAPGAGGALECTTCHRMHGAPHIPLLALGDEVLCLYCHEDANPYGARGIKPGPHPVGVLLRGDRPAAAGGPSPGGSAVLTCTTCHRAHLRTGSGPARPESDCLDGHPQRRAAAGHGGVVGCGACHGIHAQTPPAQTCAPCHPDAASGLHRPDQPLGPGSLPAFDGSGARAAAGTMGCPTCHDPHGTGAAKLRRPSPAQTCLACHEGKEAVQGGAHDPVKLGSRPGSCGPCHDAHGRQSPSGPDPAGDGCRGCHPEQEVPENHSPRGAPAWRRLREDLPLFGRDGERAAYGFVTCPTCHDVHRAEGTRALRLSTGPEPRLCLACHSEKATLLGTAHDRLGPPGEGACPACHEVHRARGPAGQGPAPWQLRVGAAGSWNDRKCSPCHTLASDAPDSYGGTGSHPANVALSRDVKPQGLPLFDPLGGPFGRLVTCATCHEVHGVRDPEGKGAIARFLRKSPREGELCVSCHPRQGAVVSTPHDLRRGWPTDLGPCGPCHVAHAARGPRALWGLDPAPGAYLPNTLCRSCHRQGGPVQGEFLLLQHHMKDAEDLRTPRGTSYLQRPMTLLDERALRTGESPVIPLYDRDGTEGPVGGLQCVSCHDPHVWSPMGPFIKPGFGALGPNVPTRFLRLADPAAAARGACAACHKADAPERYRKYHLVWGDVGEEFR